MFSTLFRLELAKHRNSFFGLLLIIALSLIFTTIGVTLFGHQSVQETLTGVTVFLLLAGLPLSALLFGSVGGTSLRREAEASSEELLPVHPVRKILLSYLASLLYLLLTCAVLYLLSIAVHLPVTLLETFKFPWILIAVLPLHVLALLFCYWLKQPILGSGLALILIGTQIYFLLLLFPLFSHASGLWITIPCALLIELAVLLSLAKRIERGMKAGYIRGFLLTLPLLVCLIMFPMLILLENHYTSETHESYTPDRANPNGKIQAVSLVLLAPPTEMRTALHSAYRLKPDRRFLSAINEVAAFLGKKELGPISVQFQNDHWRIEPRGLKTIELPELPDFPDFVKVLSSLIQSQQQVSLSESAPTDAITKIDQKISGFWSSDVLAGLEEIDRLWTQGKHDPRLLRLAARGQIYLSMQSLDKMETADLIPARALAFWTLATQLTQDKMDREGILLAQLLGYTKQAETTAGTLPAEDPVRLYVTREDEKLKTLALQSGDPATKYFCLLRAEESQDTELWPILQQQIFGNTDASLPILKTATGAGRDEYADSIPGAILQELGQTGSADLDQILKTAGGHQTGPFLNSESYRAFYEAHYFSALYLSVIHTAEHASSGIEGTARLSKEMQGSGQEITKEFQTWLQHFAAIKQQQPGYTQFEKDIHTLSTLGAPPFIHSLEALTGNEWIKQRNFGSVQTLASRMDSRMEHRYQLAQIGVRKLADLNLAQKMYDSILRHASKSSSTMFIAAAHFTGNQQELISMMHESHCGPECGADIIWNLFRPKDINSPLLIKECDQFLARYPDSWRVRENYVVSLREHNLTGKACSILEVWLKTHQNSGVDTFNAQLKLAHTHYLGGEYQQGWEALQPILPAGYGNVLSEAGLLLAGLGRGREAESMAKDAIKQSPENITYRIDLAHVYWQSEKYAEASAALKDYPYRITDMVWCNTIADRFTHAFLHAPDEEITIAYSALKATIPPAVRTCFLVKISETGARAAALNLMMKSTPDEHLLIKTYKIMKAAQGQEKAMKWLLDRDTRRINGNPLTYYALEEGLYEVLWDFPFGGDPAKLPEALWLRRAMASIQIGKQDSHRAELLRYYEKPGGGYHAIGRYLLGMIPEQTLLAEARNAALRSEISYYIGFKAEAESHFEDASDWYRISAETGNSYDVAILKLTVWAIPGQGLWRVIPERINH